MATSPDAAQPQLDSFAMGYDFPFDDFQVQACRAVAAGDGVLVAAPTGAGKTVVGEFAVVVEEHRPVPLWQHMMVGEDLYDLFADEVSAATGVSDPTRVNPELLARIRGGDPAGGHDGFARPRDGGADGRGRRPAR